MRARVAPVHVRLAKPAPVMSIVTVEPAGAVLGPIWMPYVYVYAVADADVFVPAAVVTVTAAVPGEWALVVPVICVPALFTEVMVTGLPPMEADRTASGSVGNPLPLMTTVLPPLASPAEGLTVLLTVRTGATVYVAGVAISVSEPVVPP